MFEDQIVTIVSCVVVIAIIFIGLISLCAFLSKYEYLF